MLKNTITRTFLFICLALIVTTSSTSFAVGGSNCTELFAKRMSAFPEGMIPISGYASVFGVRDAQNEITTTQTFEVAVKNFNAFLENGTSGKEIYMQYAHNPRTDIGRWTYMDIDERGLYVEGYIDPQEPSAQEMFKDWRKKPFNGLSVAGTNQGNDWTDRGPSISAYTVWEISLVAEPSNRSAYFDMPATPYTVRTTADKFFGLLDRFLKSEGRR